jgi:hypothetical protein
MMAIDRLTTSNRMSLTTQRKDLIDLIAATNDAIKKIDKTTREGFLRRLPPSTRTRETFRRCSAAVAPASSFSTRAISLKAGST